MTRAGAATCFHGRRSYSGLVPQRSGGTQPPYQRRSGNESHIDGCGPRGRLSTRERPATEPAHAEPSRPLQALVRCRTHL